MSGYIKYDLKDGVLNLYMTESERYLMMTNSLLLKVVSENVKPKSTRPQCFYYKKTLKHLKKIEYLLENIEE